MLRYPIVLTTVFFTVALNAEPIVNATPSVMGMPPAQMAMANNIVPPPPPGPYVSMAMLGQNAGSSHGVMNSERIAGKKSSQLLRQSTPWPMRTLPPQQVHPINKMVNGGTRPAVNPLESLANRASIPPTFYRRPNYPGNYSPSTNRQYMDRRYMTRPQPQTMWQPFAMPMSKYPRPGQQQLPAAQGQ